MVSIKHNVIPTWTIGKGIMKRSCLRVLVKKHNGEPGRECNTAPLKNLCRYVVYFLTFLTMGITLWTLVLGSTEMVTVTFSSNQDNVKALYKCAYENPDGSVDLVFNIPKGGKDLLRLNEIHLNQSKANSNNQTTAANNSTQQVVLADEKNVIRSSYPLSLDSPYLINTLHICPVGKQVDYIIIVHRQKQTIYQGLDTCKFNNVKDAKLSFHVAKIVAGRHK